MKSSEPKVESKSTLSATQQAVESAYGRYLQGNIGDNLPSYTGKINATQPTMINAAANAFNNDNRFTSSINKAVSSMLEGKPAYTYNGARIESNWRKNVADPMMSTFRRSVVPVLNEGMSDSVFNSRRLNILADKTQDFYESSVAPSLFEAQMQGEQMAFQSGENAAGRVPEAVNMAANLPYQQFMQRAGVGMQLMDLEQQRLDRTKQEWESRQSYNSPYNRYLLSYLGTPTIENVGYQQTNNSGNLINAGAGILAALMM